MDRSVESTLLWTFALTITVSAGLFILLVVRQPASLNVLNLLTIFGTSLSTLAMLYFFRNIILLLLSYVAFVLSTLLAGPSPIYFLYVPSLLILSIVVALAVFSKAKGRFAGL